MSQRRPILDEVRAFYKPKAGGLNQTWPRPLIASGRAVHHLNMAISWLGETNELEAATYHTFAGVASAAAAVDGMALFLNFWFVAGCEGPPTRTEPWPHPSTMIDFMRKDFRTALKAKIAVPAVWKEVERLTALRDRIKPYRDRALHRDGLIVGGGERPELPWRLRPLQWLEAFGDTWVGPLGDGFHVSDGPDPEVVPLLTTWRDGLDSTIRGVLRGLEGQPMPPPPPSLADYVKSLDPQ